MSEKKNSTPAFFGNVKKWIIRFGGVIFSENRFDKLATAAVLAPIGFWVAISIVLHKLGTRNFFEPSFIYPAFLGPFFVFIPISAVARHLSDKIFGDYYAQHVQDWNSSSASEYYQEAISKMSHAKASQITVYAIAVLMQGLLFGWIVGVAGFWIFVY